MASCADCTDEVVVEDSVDSDGTASPLRHGRILGRDQFSSQTSAGLTEPAGGMENSRLLCTQEEQMFSSSEEEDSEHSQLLLPQSLQISPHLSHLKRQGENSPVFPPHLSHLKPPGENSPVFPPPAKIRKLAGETRTKEEPVANVDNDSDVTNMSDNIEPRPERDLGDTSHDLAEEQQNGGHGMKGCHGDQSSKCSWEDQQTKSSAGVKQTAAVHNSADRSAAATESIEETKLSKVHQEGDFGKERITNENGREGSETCVEKGKEVKSIPDVSEGSGENAKEATRTADISGVEKGKESTLSTPDVSKESAEKGKGATKIPDTWEGSGEKGKEGTRTPDISEGSETCRRVGSSAGSSSLGSLQESVAAVSDIGAEKTLCHQHEEEMQLLSRLEGRQEKLNPLLSTKDKTAALKVQRELSCIQTLIGTLIQAHQRQRTAISALRDSEQMQEQMRLFVQRHKRLVQIFSAQKTATAKFKGRMEVTTTQSNTKVTGNIANQSQPTSQTSSGKNEREVLIGRKSIGGKRGKKSAASSTKSGSSESSSVKFQGAWAVPSGKETTSLRGAADHKLPLATSPITAEASGESTTAMQVLQALDCSSQLRAVLKTGSLQKGQIVSVVSKDGQESVRYRVVGMESVGATASTNNLVAPNIQYDSENVARSTATVVSNVRHTTATTLSPACSKLAPAATNNQVDPNIQHVGENVASSTATVVSYIGHTTATALSSVSGNLAPAATNNRVDPNIQHGGENVTRSTATVVSNIGHTTATTLSPASSKLAQLVQQANATTDSSQVLLKAGGWKTPFKPSSTASSVARLAEEESQDVLDVAKTNAREEKLKNTKGTKEAGVSAQSRAEVLWQKIVPQVQKQFVTSAKPVASVALKECLVGNKGLSTTGGVGGQLQGLSSTGRAGGQLQGLSTTGGAGGQLQGPSTTGVAGGQLKGLSTTGGARGQLQGQSTTGGAGGQHKGLSTTVGAGAQHKGLFTTGRGGGQLQGLSATGGAGGQLQGPSTTAVAGRQLQGPSTSGVVGGQRTQRLSTTGGAGGQLQGLSTTGGTGGQLQGQSTTGRAGGQLQGPSTTDVAGRQLQGLSTSGVIGGQLTQGLSTTGRAGGQLQGLSTTGGAGGQHTLGLYTTGVAGGQLKGLSTTAVVEGQAQGTEVPTVTELLRAKLIQPGKDVLSCRGKAGLQFGSLSPDGAVTQGGLTFSTVAQWHRALWGHRTAQKRAMVYRQVRTHQQLLAQWHRALWGLRTAQKRAMVYRQVCFRGTPLADFSSGVTPAGQTVSPSPAHLQPTQGTGVHVTPAGQSIPPAHLQQAGVTPARQTFSPAPAHLSSSGSTCQKDVEMMEEQQQPSDVSLPSSGSTSPGKTALQDATQDSKVLRPASILLITDEEFFVSRQRLPDKFWDSAEVKLNQFLEAAVNFE